MMRYDYERGLFAGATVFEVIDRRRGVCDPIAICGRHEMADRIVEALNLLDENETSTRPSNHTTSVSTETRP